VNADVEIVLVMTGDDLQKGARQARLTGKYYQTKRLAA
jgi:hypothetical protein